MTYSNTKKDKVQVSYRQKLKNMVIAVGLIIFIISAWINIIGQLQTLIEAEKINRNLSLKIDDLQYQLKVEEAKVKEATTAAYLEKKVRNMLGLGKEGDKWIILPKIEGNINIGQSFYEDVELPIVRQWWKLFFDK